MKTYINLLNRYKKAEEFFRNASIEEQKKYCNSFEKLLCEIVRLEKKLINSGKIEQLKELRQKTFLEIERGI